MANRAHIICITIGVLVAGIPALYKLVSFTNQIKNRIKSIEQELSECKAMNTSLFELYSERVLIPEKKRVPATVLCLGNSITFHSRTDNIEWHSEWGMAASKQEKDYCHQLERLLKSRDTLSSVVPMNIASWERGLRFSQVDSLIGEEIVGKDAVVIRLGENVTDKQRFDLALDSLVTYCLNKVPRVVLTGCFWREDQKELSIMRVSRKRNVDYVPLFWIDELYDARVRVGGGELFDTQGNTYLVSKDFITSHPNDLGHKMIAEEIFKAL